MNDLRALSYPEPEWFTVAEVAERMRVSRMTVYRLVEAGELPAARIGRSVRINGDDVESFLRGAAFPARGEPAE
jgi:excisionase family DNA binding protein